MKTFNAGTFFHDANAVIVDGRILGIAAPAALVFFIAYALLPAFLIPGNNAWFQLQLTFQLALTNPLTLAIMLALAVGSGYVVAIQWRLFERRRKASSGVQATGTAASGLLAAVFASAACTSCLAALFPFLSGAAIISLASYQWHFVVVGFVLIFGSLYFSVKQYGRLHKNK